MKQSNFNDGIVNVYNDKGQKTDFGAKKNVKTLDDMEFVVKLAYDEKSKRQQDYEFAEQMGTKLTMKICTPLVSSVHSKQKAVINSYLYDITHIDPDRTKK